MSLNPGRCLRITMTLALATAVATIAGCGGAPPGRPPAEAAPEPAEASPLPVLMDAEVAAKAGDYDAAINIIREILSGNTDDIEALRLLARVQAASGDRAGSAGTWERVAALDPYDPDAAYEVGMALSKKNDWEGVRARMVSIDSAGKADARHYLLAGQADLELGYRSEAEKYLVRAGDLELAQSLLGQLYYDRGDLGSAEDAFLKALAINGSNYSANLHMGYIRYHEKQYRGAIRYYGAAQKAEPSDPLACLSLAAAYEKSGDRGSAIKYYRKGLGLAGVAASERKKVYTTTARLLLETGRLDEVEKLASAGTEEFSSAGGLYFYWGEALLKQGRDTEAKDKYKKAAEDPAWKDSALKRFHSIR
jgi:tetratricopeptide (TPR) repeat protein